MASNRTLQKDRATLHAIFAFAEELELREGNPVGRVSVPKADPRDPVILSDEQYEKLLAACGDRSMLSLYVLLLGETGARCESEALYLRWEDVDFEGGGFLKIASGRDGHRTKSGKGRWVPMTPRLKQALRDHFAQFRFATYGGSQTPWVFHHERSRRRANAGERIASLRSSFSAAAEKAGLPKELHQHDLRHRRVTTWLAEGGNPVHVKEAMGHSDLRTTMAYTHLAREHLQCLVGRSTSPEATGPVHRAALSADLLLPASFGNAKGARTSRIGVPPSPHALRRGRRRFSSWIPYVHYNASRSIVGDQRYWRRLPSQIGVLV